MYRIRTISSGNVPASPQFSENREFSENRTIRPHSLLKGQLQGIIHRGHSGSSRDRFGLKSYGGSGPPFLLKYGSGNYGKSYYLVVPNPSPKVQQWMSRVDPNRSCVFCLELQEQEARSHPETVGAEALHRTAFTARSACAPRLRAFRNARHSSVSHCIVRTPR